jgi:nitric oxide reductase subunit B
MNGKTGLYFILAALACLAGGLLAGLVGVIQFIEPGWFEWLPFVKSRPLHVSLVITWVFMAGVGGIYYYLPAVEGQALYSEKMARWHLWLFLATGLTVIGCYLSGRFGGREYWEYPAVLAIPILASWALLGVNYYKTAFRIKSWPVYYWMWGTGILFFFLTYLEANAWVIPYFRSNLIRELTIQWKSNGALVGSWNMLAYGTSLYVMEKISGGRAAARSRIAFLMYFLGFANLLFNWGHHTYVVPSAPWVRIVAYAVSMTELIILARIIWNWKGSLTTARRLRHRLSYRFMLAAEFWIFVNLTLAILISVPAIHIYTHGTHITVAHAMGSTIGINTMILLSSVFFMLRPAEDADAQRAAGANAGFWIANASLLVFFVCLVVAGAIKGYLTIEERMPHALIMDRILPWLTGFGAAGAGVTIGLLLVVWKAMGGVLAMVRKPG